MSTLKDVSDMTAGVGSKVLMYLIIESASPGELVPHRSKPVARAEGPMGWSRLRKSPPAHHSSLQHSCMARTKSMGSEGPRGCLFCPLFAPTMKPSCGLNYSDM